jgi:HAD superfamily hydrolase (TIGR01490 family)
MKLALFDLDNTLLSGDTDVEWFAFLTAQGALPQSEQQANVEMDRRYRAGEASVHEYVRFYLRPYPRHDIAQLREWRSQFLEKHIVPRMLPAGRDLLYSHRNELVIIITATNRFLTEPIARAFGVEHLIATEPQMANGRFTGDVVGEPCMREGKIVRLEAWLAQRRQTLLDFERSWFYSDSVNDVPLLERVTDPVAVDPDERLRAIAAERRWRIISLR